MHLPTIPSLLLSALHIQLLLLLPLLPTTSAVTVERMCDSEPSADFLAETAALAQRRRDQAAADASVPHMQRLEKRAPYLTENITVPVYFHLVTTAAEAGSYNTTQLALQVSPALTPAPEGRDGEKAGDGHGEKRLTPWMGFTSTSSWKPTTPNTTST